MAIVSVLMFPLDIANRGACRENIALSSCELTLPMRRIWFAMYISNAVLVFIVTPFTLFYYEGGSDRYAENLGAITFMLPPWLLCAII